MDMLPSKTFNSYGSSSVIAGGSIEALSCTRLRTLLDGVLCQFKQLIGDRCYAS